LIFAAAGTAVNFSATTKARRDSDIDRTTIQNFFFLSI
jgi:hypothetical protein